MEPVLEFEGVTKQYRRGWRSREAITALHDFSLRIERGEIFGFLGPNGAGKTTAIHIAMGFMRPTSGGGRMLGTAFGDAATHARVGFLAENVALYHRPAGRLLCFYGELSGVPGPQVGHHARMALDAVGLESEADRNVGKFSRGMLQRIGLAQALVGAPDLLILDEPTSALDPAGRVAVRELLLALRAQGKTIFLSSHLLSEIEVVCDRIGILRAGKLVRVGQTSELLERHDQAEIVARGVVRGESLGDGLTRFTVNAAEQRAAIEQVWSLGGEVVSVNPLRRSLEELFLEVTSEEPRT